MDYRTSAIAAAKPLPPYCIDVAWWHAIYNHSSAQAPFAHVLADDVRRARANGRTVRLQNVPSELEAMVAALSQE